MDRVAGLAPACEPARATAAPGVVVRILADDLTGALDTAAEFVGLCGEMVIAWNETGTSASVAIDSGTRERSAPEAAAAVAPLVGDLARGTIAFKKVDSLLRGPWAAELAACWASGAWARCIVAPAFPFQGRRTRGGVQQVRGPDGLWSPAGPDPLDALRQVGIEAVRATGAGLPEAGVCVVDAETDADLAAIAAAGRARSDAPVLWCGSGGLARALAGGRGVVADTRLAGSVLGLFGSDQPATAAQLAACRDVSLAISPADADAAGIVDRAMETRGTAMVWVDHLPGTTRHDAAGRNEAAFGALARRLDRPGTLLVAGGETLKALCLSLGTRSLRVTGQVAPGLPRSVMVGGRWDGVPVVSKSGAFGPPALWRDLLALNHLLPDRIDA